MKIVVFGATGKTGSSFIKYALEQGHEIVAFARNPEKITEKNLRLKVVKGSPFNKEEVLAAINGQDIVVSCLGGDGNKKSTILSQMIKNIVDVMKESNVNRIVHISTAGVHGEIPGVITNFIISLFLKNAIKDHKQAADYIISSGLTYTIARPMSLVDGEANGNYRTTYEGVPKGGSKVSREDLAAFLLTAVNDEELENKSIGIAY